MRWWPDEHCRWAQAVNVVSGSQYLHVMAKACLLRCSLSRKVL